VPTTCQKHKIGIIEAEFVAHKENSMAAIKEKTHGYLPT
jgi:hypothetical protein